MATVQAVPLISAPISFNLLVTAMPILTASGSSSVSLLPVQSYPGPSL